MSKWAGLRRLSYNSRGRVGGLGAAAAFTPDDLFAVSEAGGWWDPSDFSTMFQTEDESTPVTATGQSVGRINDKSGNGLHATQATASLRPVLQQDANGNYYLDADADDQLVLGATGISGSQNREFFFSGHTVTSGSTIVSLGPNATGERWTFRDSSGNLRVEISGSGYTSSLACTTTDVYGLALNGTTLADHTLHAGASTETATGTNTVNTTDNSNALFESSSFSGTGLTGRFYGGVFIGRVLTGGERADLKAYLKDKAGVT